MGYGEVTVEASGLGACYVGVEKLVVGNGVQVAVKMGVDASPCDSGRIYPLFRRVDSLVTMG